MVEAVALFDYHGRTTKELSFKTNQIIYIYKKMNHEWWLGHIAGRNQSGFIPDGYIKLKSRRRDSAPVQHLPPFSLTPNPSSSLHSIDFTTSSNDQLDIPISNQATKETDILTIPQNRPIYDVLPSSPTNGHDHSSSSSSSSSHLTSIHDQQIIDIDTALREVLSGIRTVEECHAQCFRSITSSNIPQEIDAPDLVLNLPISSGFLTPPSSKSLDDHLSLSIPPIVHSTIIIDLKHSSPERKKIPPPIMKKPEKTIQLIKRLGLQKQQTISISGSSKATEV